MRTIKYTLLLLLLALVCISFQSWLLENPDFTQSWIMNALLTFNPVAGIILFIVIVGLALELD